MVKAIWAVACSLLALFLALSTPVAPAYALEAAEGGAPSDVSTFIDRATQNPRPTSGQRDSADPSAYRLGPEDQLRISVWDNKDLTMDLVVRPDGKISMPLIQDVVAEGLTAAQLAENIRKKLAAYIVNPEVTVIVLQVNAPKYYMMGYVTHPGTYPLRGDVSVLQALSLAGGFTQFASPRKIKLIRNVNGKQQIRKINYYDMIDDGGRGNYLLQPGDTVVVP